MRRCRALQVVHAVLLELSEMCTVTITKQCTVVKVIGRAIGLFLSSLLQVYCATSFQYHA